MPVDRLRVPAADGESLIPEAGRAGVLGQMTTRAGTDRVRVSGCPRAWRARPAGWPCLPTAAAAGLAARARRRSLVSVIAATRPAISTPAATARSTTSDRSRCPGSDWTGAAWCALAGPAAGRLAGALDGGADGVGAGAG